jgi:outer membrane immunogenic protein
MNWVFGFETDIQGSAQKGSGGAICAGGTLAGSPFNGACTPGHIGETPDFNSPGLPVRFDLSQKLEWFGTFRGRVGATFTPTRRECATVLLSRLEISTSYYSNVLLAEIERFPWL